MITNENQQIPAPAIIPVEQININPTAQPDNAEPTQDASMAVAPTNIQPTQDLAPLQNEMAVEASAEYAQRAPVNGLRTNIMEALGQGTPEEELKSFLVTNKKMTPGDADASIVDSVKNSMQTAISSGYSQEEVKQFMLSRYSPELVAKTLTASNSGYEPSKYDYRPDLQPQERAQEISDLYSNVYMKYSTIGNMIRGVFDEDAAISARQDINKLNNAITLKLIQQGINAYIDQDTGAVMMKDANGQVSEVDSSFLSGLYNSQAEMTGAIAGGSIGARVGATAGVPFGPIGAGAGALAGGIVGGAIGATLGRGVDVLTNAHRLSEDLSANLVMTQMKEAGIFDGVASVVGIGVFKLGVSGYRGIMKAYRFASHGNPEGAFTALKDNLNLTDEQAQEIVTSWERLNNPTLPAEEAQRLAALSPHERAVAIIQSTHQGSETSVKSAAAMSERVATLLQESVDNRAKSLNRVINNITDENTGQAVRTDLAAYQSDVKLFYDTIKRQGMSAVQGTDFKFNLEQTAIEPVMNAIQSRISDPTLKERFVGYATRIANASQDRSFGGLLELRSAVNDFKYSRTVVGPDLEAVNNVINKIDGQVAKAARDYMGDAAPAWLENFSRAKSEYGRMKQLQENVLFRSINRPGATEESIQKALSRYGSNKDVDTDTFNAVASRLSPETRTKVEGAAIRNLASRFTYGEATDFQAINFAQLSQELKTLNLTTRPAVNLTRVVDAIANVYKNDHALAAISGRSLMSRPTNLATSIEGKVRMAFFQNVWERVVKYAPTRNARNLALVHKTEELLRNPLHAATAEQLLKEFPSEMQPQVRSLMRTLQEQVAKAGPRVPPKVFNMYKQSASGGLSMSNGALGKGVYLFDRVTNAPVGANIIAHPVEVDKLATLDTISGIVGRPVNISEVRSIAGLADKLYAAGFDGIRYDNKAMLFPQAVGKPAEAVMPKIGQTSVKPTSTAATKIGTRAPKVVSEVTAPEAKSAVVATRAKPTIGLYSELEGNKIKDLFKIGNGFRSVINAKEFTKNLINALPDGDLHREILTKLENKITNLSDVTTAIYNRSMSSYKPESLTIKMGTKVNNTPTEMVRVYTHELVHTLTAHAMREDKALAKEFKGLLDIYRKSWAKDYASRNADEFIAEALSNKDTISKLANIPYGVTNLADKFYNFVIKALGLKADDKTLLAKVLSTFDNINPTEIKRMTVRGLDSENLKSHAQINDYSSLYDAVTLDKTAVTGVKKLFSYERGKSLTNSYVIDEIAALLPRDNPQRMMLGLMRGLIKDIDSVKVVVANEKFNYGMLVHNRNIIIMPNSGENSAEYLVKTYTHELSHALTIKAMADNPKVFDQFSSIYKQYKKAYKNDSNETLAMLGLDDYARTNVYEFIAEAMSNEETMAKMASIPYKSNRNLFNWFVERIFETLGLDYGLDPNNLLSAFVDTVFKIKSTRLKSDLLIDLTKKGPKFRAPVK